MEHGLQERRRRALEVGVSGEGAILPSQELGSFGECKKFVPLGQRLAWVGGAIFTRLQVYLEWLNTAGKHHNLEDNQATRIVEVFI